MNISLYIFGEFKNGYSQYPDDYTSAIFHQFYTHARSTTQIAIHRDGNLMYYGYIRKLPSSRYIGLCAVINGIMLSRFDTLFSIYEDTISQLVCQEIILRFNTQGEIETTIETLNTASHEIEILKELLNTKFKELKNITQPLPPVCYGVSKDSIQAFTLQDSTQQILKSSYTEGYTYIYKSKEYNSIQLKQYQKILQQLNKEKQELNIKYRALVKEHEKTLKQKKQFKIVSFLSIIVAGIGICTLMLTKNLSQTHQELSQAQDSIMQKEKTIALLNSEISNLTTQTRYLNDAVKKEKTKRKYVETKLSATRDTIRQHLEKIMSLQAQTEEWETKISNAIPLIISKLEMGNIDINSNIETPHGNAIYSSQTMYLSPKLHYIGIKQRQVTLSIKLFTPSGTLSQGEKSPVGYSYSQSININKGENSIIVGGWGNQNKGKWESGQYRIEIWYEDVCLKAHTFTIHP